MPFVCSFAQPALEFLESAHMLWDNTVNKAYRVKGEIQPLQNAAADGVRKDIGAFGEEVGHVWLETRWTEPGYLLTALLFFSLKIK